MYGKDSKSLKYYKTILSPMGPNQYTEPELKGGECKKCGHNIIRINGKWSHWNRKKDGPETDPLKALKSPEWISFECKVPGCDCKWPEPKINE